MDATVLRPARTSSPATESRLRARRSAAILAGLVAAVYVLIAADIVTVIDAPADDVARDQFGFAAPAVVAYALGAFLLLRYDARWLWTLGAVFDALVITMYFVVAPERDPAFELWGITLRVLQLLLLVPLVRLAWHRPREGRPTTA